MTKSEIKRLEERVERLKRMNPQVPAKKNAVEDLPLELRELYYLYLEEQGVKKPREMNLEIPVNEAGIEQLPPEVEEAYYNHLRQQRLKTVSPEHMESFMVPQTTVKPTGVENQNQEMK